MVFVALRCGARGSWSGGGDVGGCGGSGAGVSIVPVGGREDAIEEAWLEVCAVCVDVRVDGLEE